MTSHVPPSVWDEEDPLALLAADPLKLLESEPCATHVHHDHMGKHTATGTNTTHHDICQHHKSHQKNEKGKEEHVHLHTAGTRFESPISTFLHPLPKEENEILSKEEIRIVSIPPIVSEPIPTGVSSYESTCHSPPFEQHFEGAITRARAKMLEAYEEAVRQAEEEVEDPVEMEKENEEDPLEEEVSRDSVRIVKWYGLYVALHVLSLCMLSAQVKPESKSNPGPTVSKQENGASGSSGAESPAGRTIR